MCITPDFQAGSGGARSGPARRGVARLGDGREIEVLPHARKRYRETVNKKATNEEIAAHLARAWENRVLLRGHFTGGDRYRGEGIVFAAVVEGNTVAVKTVFGTVARYFWELKKRRREMKRAVMKTKCRRGLKRFDITKERGTRNNDHRR